MSNRGRNQLGERWLCLQVRPSFSIYISFSTFIRFSESKTNQFRRTRIIIIRRRKAMAGGGGTEAFPDLGEHCQNPDCKLLDFLPFTCDGCKSVYFPRKFHFSLFFSCKNLSINVFKMKIYRCSVWSIDHTSPTIVQTRTTEAEQFPSAKHVL